MGKSDLINLVSKKAKLSTEEARKVIEFSAFIKISAVPVIFMFVISSLSFAVKSLSGKPNFKNELLTGALCGIPLGLLIPVALIIKILVSEDNIEKLNRNPMAAGVIGMLLFFYLIEKLQFLLYFCKNF